MSVITQRNEKRWAKIREKTFVYALILLPLLNFIIFFAMCKIDSVLLAFQSYKGGEFVMDGLTNFKQIFQELFVDKSLLRLFGNSAKVYLINLVFFPLHIFVAYLIWKKIPLSGFFKVVLFLPSIIPSMVFLTAYCYLVEWGFPIFFNNPEMGNLLSSSVPDRAFTGMMTYGVFMGLASGLVIYLGTISSVNHSVVEYGKLEGLGMLREFWHIILPHIYPTVTTFFVAGVSGILTADCGLFTFFGEGMAPDVLHTIGYRIAVYTKAGSVNYPYLSALGLTISIVAIPFTFIVKWLMEKYGPSEE